LHGRQLTHFGPSAVYEDTRVKDEYVQWMREEYSQYDDN
jgi:hypothetical protein